MSKKEAGNLFNRGKSKNNLEERYLKEGIETDKEKRKTLRQEGSLRYKLGKHKHKFTSFFMIVLFIIIIFIVVFQIVPILSGRGDSEKVEVGAQKQISETKANLKKSGLERTFNDIKRIVTGNYDPEEIWSSEQVQSDYAEEEEFEFMLEDIAPTRSYFYNTEIISLSGRLNVISGINQGTNVSLTAEEDNFNWDCSVSGESGKNTFEFRNLYNREFFCETNKTPGEAEFNLGSNNVGVVKPEISWSYETSGVAGKQFYVFSEDALQQHKNPVNYFDIDKEGLQSWYIGDDSVNLGIGLDRPNQLIRAFSSEYLPIYSMGVTIRNEGIGDITKLSSLSITYPFDLGACGSDGGDLGVRDLADGFDLSESKNGDYRKCLSAQPIVVNASRSSDFVDYPILKMAEVGDSSVPVAVYSLNTSQVKINKIAPGDYKTFYLDFWVDEDTFLGGSSFRSFLAKVDASYIYENGEEAVIEIRGKEAASGSSTDKNAGQ